ncbi:unnamed protein product, partial [Rotaria sordida]
MLQLKTQLQMNSEAVPISNETHS